MYLWLITYNLFILSSLPRFIKWLYLWQKKEYRGDKMMDYLTLAEGQKMVFDKWFVARIMGIYLLWLSAQFSSLNFLEGDGFLVGFLNTLRRESLGFSLEFSLVSNLSFAILILIALIMVLEIIDFGYKFFIKKNLLLPKYTTKLLLHITLGTLSLIFLPLLFSGFWYVDFIYTLSFIYILIPIIIGYWLLAMFPVDWIIKNRVFKKAKLVREKLGQEPSKLNVIAVSGSYGKTGTKEILHQFLSTSFVSQKTIKNQNSNISCARQLISLGQKTEPKTEQFVCELGSYKQGDGNEICQFLLPDVAVITGINHQHYALFGSIAKVLAAETESLAFLPHGALVVVNWCSELNRKLTFEPNLKVIKIATEGFGVEKNEVDYYADNIKFDNKSLQTSFELTLPNTTKSIKLTTNLMSIGDAQNIVQAIATALELGVKIEKIEPVLSQLVQSQGTLELSKKGTTTIINDSYNANFDGVVNAIDLLSKMEKQKILVLDDIMELGKLSEPTHLKLAKYISHTNLDTIILVGKNFAGLVQKELIKNNFEAKKILVWEESKEKQAEILKLITDTGNNFATDSATDSTNTTNLLFEGKGSQKLLDKLMDKLG